MSNTIELEVTQEDIDLGKPHSNCNCPLARAGKRLLGVEVLVGRARLITLDDVGSCYIASPEACAFVESFDNGKPVLPGKYKFTNKTSLPV